MPGKAGADLTSRAGPGYRAAGPHGHRRFPAHGCPHAAAGSTARGQLPLRPPARCRPNSQLAIFQSLAPPTRASTIPTRLKMIDKLRVQPSLAHLWFRECWGKAGYIAKVPLNALGFG